MQAPPVISRRRFSFWWLMLIVPLAIAGCLTLFYFNPTQYRFYPRCTLFVLTGIYCPGCGCLRAVHQLTHGQLLAALHSNVLLIIGTPLLALDAYQYFYRRTTAGFAQMWITRPWVWKIGIAVIVLFTILRNIHAAPFNWLVPQ